MTIIVECDKPEFVTEKNMKMLEFFEADLETEFKVFNLNIFGTTRIDWRNEKNISIYNADKNDLLSTIKDFISEKSGLIEVHWDDASICNVRMDIEFLKQYLDEINNETNTYWIIPLNKKWVIECYKWLEVVIKKIECE
jgi:hypothetical protein